jgi:hypothetical protein
MLWRAGRGCVVRDLPWTVEKLRIMGCSPRKIFAPEVFPIETGQRKYQHIFAVKKLAHFKQKKNYAMLCLAGPASFPEMVERMIGAVRLCRKKNINKLLIDSTGWTEFHVPGIAERFNFNERIASEAESSVKIAHVANPEWVRSRTFGITVAKNRGLDMNLFSSESKALKWLLGK